MKIKLKLAFTLSEVLITLAIIGIVASMTIPTLINKFEKVQYIAGFKKAYAEFQNMLKQYMAEEGVSDLSQTPLYTSGSVDFKVWDDIIHKYFKVIQACQSTDTECNIFRDHYTLSHSTTTNSYNHPYTYYFCSVDGMCFCVNLRTTECKMDYSVNSNMKGLCGYINIDVNGNKLPNVEGRDFMNAFAISPDGNLFPEYGEAYAKYESRSSNWRNTGYYWANPGGNGFSCGTPGSSKLPDSVNGDGCLARVMEEGWQMNY